jgi:chromosome segregation ATPase
MFGYRQTMANMASTLTFYTARAIKTFKYPSRGIGERRGWNHVTRITRLEMKGFKSFANKTELHFGDGFNCILGPNGSGKSNVLDALCFVLGKSSAKGLRAEKSANLIYNGGKKKSPAKQGEVSIVFDNSLKKFGDEFDELMITRIVMQSGQSKYKINGRIVAGRRSSTSSPGIRSILMDTTSFSRATSTT